MGPTRALTMDWHDLLFAHWPVATERLRPLIPPGLELDTWGGSAWLGVVPFRMTHVRPLGVPLPGGRFAYGEINVRTYVSRRGRPGVWFLSLHGQDHLAAWAARRAFHLPYWYAQVRVRQAADGWIDVASRHDGARTALFRGRYRPTGPVVLAAAGSFEAFVTDRLALYAVTARGRLLRADVEHAPWPLQAAELEVTLDTMAAAHGLALPDTPPHLLFSRHLAVTGRRAVRVG
jgi:uncharacterized protein YqjF (DUF2071 family)